MQSTLTYEANKKLIDWFAWKVLRRLRAAGARALELDDIQQELAIAWIKAADSFNAERNVTFSVYLVNGMKMHINRWAEKEIGASQFTPMSLDMESEEGNELHQVIASNVKIEEEVCERDHKTKVINSLSPRAKQFITLLDNPPPQVVSIFRAMSARAEVARKKGYLSFIQKTIPAHLIYELMGANSTERQSIRREIEAKAKKWG